MAAIKQYPHYLFQEVGGVSQQNANGEWIETQSSTNFVSMCREETNGKGSEIVVAGGKYVKFSSLIQLPKGAQRIEVGANVIISNDAEGSDVRVSGVCLKYDEGQLHNRLWL